MLVLRKELKMGLGVGAAVLGVAAVYGLMSLLSSSGGTDTVSPGNNQTETLRVPEGPRGLDVARSGLPPAEGEETAATNNSTSVTPGTPIETARTDGSTEDTWTLLLSTGRQPDATLTNNRSLGNTPGADTAVRTGLPDLGVASSNTASTTAVTGSATSATTRVPGPTDRSSARTPAPAAGKYVVQPGDTYSSIAGKLYGNRNLYQAIEKANPSVDPRKIRPGMEISVPAKEAVTADRGSVDVTPSPTVTGTIDASREYRVQPGDTLHRISQRLYGKTNRWAAIYDLNKAAIGPDAGKLKVGTVLTLPEAPVR